MSRSNRQQNNGRIRPDQRNTDDTVALLGSGLTSPPDLEKNFHATMKLAMKDSCRTNYRRRLQTIAKFWKENNPDYYAVGVREVGEEELNDETKFFYGRYKLDLMYPGLNYKFVLHFLLSTKMKKDGNFKSYPDLRKYKDAIMWGAKIAKQRLPTAFYESFENFLAAYKNELAQGKKDGKVEELAADPIPMELYKLVLRWALDANNVLVWFWTMAQWNFMARSASIDPLAFHNFSVGNDSYVGKYDSSKADKAGERLSEKNIYANAQEWQMCFWTGFGIWCALRRVSFGEDHEKLFLDPGVKDGAASIKYCEQVMGVVKPHMEEVMNHMSKTKFNPYGLRKEAATYAVSGTTASPSIPSIARRGEWSIGSVLDAYWHFGSVGDHYLGRVLAGMDPNDASFSTLPPHWNMTNPLANEKVKEAMEITFGSNLLCRSTVVPILLRSLACMVFHSNGLIEQMTRCPGHDFTKLAILHDRALVNELKGLVTTEPTDGVISRPTGIPPHISIALQLKTVLSKVNDVVDKFESQSGTIVTAINSAIEKRAFDAGQITGERLKDMLDTFQKESMSSMCNQIRELRSELRGMSGVQNVTDTRTPAEARVGPRKNVYSYGGKFFLVPPDFQFPKVDLRDRLRLWLCGQTTSLDGGDVVRPFRKLKAIDLPPPVRSKFKLKWMPIFKFLEKGVGTTLPSDTATMSNDDIESYYTECLAFLKERVSYCFKKGEKAVSWTTATWSNRTSRSSILLRGLESDKAFLDEATNRNKPRAPAQKRKRKVLENPRYPERQQRRANSRQISSSGQQRHNTERESEQFAAEFSGFVMTDEMRQRDREIEEEEEKREQAEAATTATMQRPTTGRARATSTPQPTGGNFCAVVNCKYPQHELRRAHKCMKCSKLVHRLCVLESELNFEDDDYCSAVCKRAIV